MPESLRDFAMLVAALKFFEQVKQCAKSAKARGCRPGDERFMAKGVGTLTKKLLARYQGRSEP